VLRLEIETGGGERVGESGVRVAGNGGGGAVGEFFQMRAHEVGAEGAVQADGERLDVGEGVPEGFGFLGGDHGFPAEADGGGDDDGEIPAVFVEDLANGHGGGFGVEGVEDGLDHEDVGAAFDERADLVFVG